ncbi:MAG: sugar phosphate isomerase/epimerase family protein [Egibacteraceae bacterium]
MSLRYAYNTNGMQNHRLEDALALLADTGYDGVALTLDIHHLDPFAPDLPRRTQALRRCLDARGLGCVIETGARFLLDPRAKHEPTLVSREPEGRARRLEFLRTAVEVAAELGAEAVSFWAGVPAADVGRFAAWGWLADGVAALAEHAADRSVPIALEPEPGMLIETIDGWRRLREVAPTLRLALDVGHCLVTGDRDPADAVRETAADLGTVALDDMRIGVHEHLPFGDGDLDLPAVLASLVAVGWTGLCCVELSRDSHRAHTLVGDTLTALRKAEP